MAGRSEKDDTTDLSRKITHYTDVTMMCLTASSRPTEAIFRRYVQAEDKESFVAALIGCLLLRHKQWQAASTGRSGRGDRS